MRMKICFVISLLSLVWARRKRGKEKKVEIKIWGMACNVGHWALRVHSCAVNASVCTFLYWPGSCFWSAYLLREWEKKKRK